MFLTYPYYYINDKTFFSLQNYNDLCKQTVDIFLKK